MRKTYDVLTDNFIASRLQGRTGNLMFQIANGYVKALQYNRQFVAPSSESSTKHLEKTLFRKIDFNIYQTEHIKNALTIRSPFVYQENKPAEDRPTVFAGWYQSEKYFENYKEVVKDLYSPTLEFIEKAILDYPFLKNSTVASINVRRGDYLNFSSRHPVISLEYVNKAYELLPKHDFLLVISDDINWCKENIKLPNVIFNESYWDCEALWLLSLCDHFIMSNSTFSWWGAWLSRSKNKTVIAPDTWFGPELYEDTRDLYCEDWIKLPTKWENGFLKPI